MYDVLTYSRAGRLIPGAGADRISDGALDRYPATTRSGEVDIARHSTDRSLDRWGWDGAWHQSPPSGWEK